MGGGGGCCVGNCCVANCGFCCIGDFCFSDCGGDCCVGNCSHCGDSDSGHIADKTDHLIIIANEIAEMTKRADKDARKQEDEIITEINDTMNEFIKWIKETNRKNYDGTSLNINISKIEELNEDLRKKVVGSIGEKLKSRLIQTDPELSVILSETDVKKRKKNFESFYDARFRDAIRDLTKIIENSVREQSESIEREIQNRINELDVSMNEEMQAFEELKNLKTQEDSRLAEKRVEYMYYEDLCGVTLGQLSSGAR